MSEEIVNKVANSGLVTLNLEEYYPEGERVELDIAPVLWQGQILKEKEFRDYIKNNTWDIYKGKHVAIICSADAIVPTWAYMLIAIKLEPIAASFVFGSTDTLEYAIFQKALASIPLKEFEGAKVVIKGCSKLPVPISAYVELTRLLAPLASSLMFGEPCSTVPLMKKK